MKIRSLIAVFLLAQVFPAGESWGLEAGYVAEVCTPERCKGTDPYFVFRTEPGTIIIEHHVAYYPCCISLEIKAELKGSDLTVQEIDKSPPCLCPTVPFEVDITIRDVPPGTYNVYLVGPLGKMLAKATLDVVNGENSIFIRGDVDGDGKVAINDAILILSYLFGGAEIGVCLDAADVNDEGTVNIADALALLQYLFSGGKKPPPPFPEPGRDPTEDGIQCGGKS